MSFNAKKIFFIERTNKRIRCYVFGIKIFSCKKKKVEICGARIKNNGTGNNIELFNVPHPELEIEIWGNNNTVIIESSDWVKTKIEIGLPDCPVENCTVKIGKYTRINGANIALFEDDSSVIIRDNCLLSWGITIWCSDSHSILNNKGQVVNIGKKIEICEHVWIGMGVTILKNTVIPKNCVIGAYAVVTKSYDESNCVIAGNPSRVIKRDIFWDVRRPKQLLNK